MKLISKAIIYILATSKPPHYLLILKKRLKYLRAFIDHTYYHIYFSPDSQESIKDVISGVGNNFQP